MLLNAGRTARGAPRRPPRGAGRDGEDAAGRGSCPCCKVSLGAPHHWCLARRCAAHCVVLRCCGFPNVGPVFEAPAYNTHACVHTRTHAHTNKCAAKHTHTPPNILSRLLICSLCGTNSWISFVISGVLHRAVNVKWYHQGRTTLWCNPRCHTPFCLLLPLLKVLPKPQMGIMTSLLVGLVTPVRRVWAECGQPPSEELFAAFLPSVPSASVARMEACLFGYPDEPPHSASAFLRSHYLGDSLGLLGTVWRQNNTVQLETQTEGLKSLFLRITTDMTVFCSSKSNGGWFLGGGGLCGCSGKQTAKFGIPDFLGPIQCRHCLELQNVRCGRCRPSSLKRKITPGGRVGRSGPHT